MVYIAKASHNSYSLVTVDSARVCAIFARGMCVEVTRTKFFVVNGISILPLWNIQLTFEQEGFRRNERYHYTRKSARITLMFIFEIR